MFLIVTKYLLPKGYRGLTIFPFVFVKHQYDKKNTVFIHHERIHIRQQLELLIFPFLIWYFIEFIIRLMQYKKWSVAYRNISFEKEAYANEKNLDYLKSRSFWAFLKYI
jgi:hypothetical protein